MKLKLTILISFFLLLNEVNAQNIWNQLNSLPAMPRDEATGFSIGTKGYIGFGYDGSYQNDLWEFNPANNQWTQRANFGGGQRIFPIAFSIGTKGYMGTGKNNIMTNMNDFWEYNPATDSWSQKSSLGTAGRYKAVGFSLDGKGYAGTGESTVSLNDFWEYNPANDTWTQKANFGGSARKGAVGFAGDGKGYITTGLVGNTGQNDLWEYDPMANQWALKANFTGASRSNAVGFAIGTYGYVGTGIAVTQRFNDFFRYEIAPAPPGPPTADFSVNKTSICANDTVIFTDLSVDDATIWQWEFPGGTPSTSNEQHPVVIYKTPGTYSVTLTASNSHGSDVMVKTDLISVKTLPEVAISPSNPEICAGVSIKLDATGANYYTWSPGFSNPNATSQTVSPTSNTTYVLEGMDMAGCINYDTVTVVIVSPPAPPVISTDGDVLYVDIPDAVAFQWYFNGNPIAGATDPSYKATVPMQAEYYVRVEYSTGCVVNSETLAFTPTSVHDISEKFNIRVSPNPSNGKFSIELKSIPGDIAIELFDLSGKKITSQKIENTTGVVNKEFDLTTGEGIYILHITSGDNFVTRKIIIQ